MRLSFDGTVFLCDGKYERIATAPEMPKVTEHKNEFSTYLSKYVVETYLKLFNQHTHDIGGILHKIILEPNQDALQIELKNSSYEGRLKPTI